MTDGRIVTPTIRDAERLQGFEADWTEEALSVSKAGFRWKLVGNAVSVPVAAWIGRRLVAKISGAKFRSSPLQRGKKWPNAAFGGPGREPVGVDLSMWPVSERPVPLASFLRDEPKLLSYRATTGFMSRLQSSSLRYPPEFLGALERHAQSMQTQLELMTVA